MGDSPLPWLTWCVTGQLVIAWSARPSAAQRERQIWADH